MNPIFALYSLGSVVTMLAFIRTDFWFMAPVLWLCAVEYFKMACAE